MARVYVWKGTPYCDLTVADRGNLCAWETTEVSRCFLLCLTGNDALSQAIPWEEEENAEVACDHCANVPVKTCPDVSVAFPASYHRHSNRCHLPLVTLPDPVCRRRYGCEPPPPAIVRHEETKQRHLEET